MKKIIVIVFAFLFVFSCAKKSVKESTLVNQETPFVWEGANLYFLLTDRFNNSDTLNDVNFNRTKETGKLRGFEGGDIKGITQKIEEGYFKDLGINAIWMTPLVEQIHDATDEGTGTTYGYHGYWAKDWTTLDPNFGTPNELKELIGKAHANDIRIVFDAVINHTGPATNTDPAWNDDWVRTSPKCTFVDFEMNTSCMLVENLPDIRTDSNENVPLPIQLVEKWKKEGRYEQEIKELDLFFERTEYPRAPRFYIMKWLTDYITEYGIDGYRVDTVKHTEETIWAEFKIECDYAFSQWKENNPTKVLDQNDFYMFGEAYNYNISQARAFDFGDKKVNYFDFGFDAMINFEFETNARGSYESLFSSYSSIIKNNIKGNTVVNYATSHDDDTPFDMSRAKPIETANKLLLCPGISQVYYGDESARTLLIDDTDGDATLRSFMNWDAIENDAKTKEIFTHWQKLGRFRANHPSVGAGTHQMISQKPYVFYRSFSKDDYKDLVVVGLDLSKGIKTLDVSKIFKDGDVLHDVYSNQDLEVINGKVSVNSEFNIVLLE